MKSIFPNNSNAMTGRGYVHGLADGFFSSETIGNIDAPTHTVTGSTFANVINYSKNHSLHDLNGRYVIPNIVFRG
jgi:hypothetical protein